MMRSHFMGALLAAGCVGGASAQALSCPSSSHRSTQKITGEISGKNIFLHPFGIDWRLQLLPSNHGWDLKVLNPTGADLSDITPPLRGAPNPRQIYGWHFRNAANTGTNTGDVNAPQHVRSFQFSPAADDAGPGSGTLRLLDSGLADLEPGERARFTYLKFEACLEWPKSAAGVGASGPALVEESGSTVAETMFGCGLQSTEYQLGPWLSPALLSGDLDGDGVLDSVAPVVRKSDGRRGLAVCLGAAKTVLVGFTKEAAVPMKTALGEPKNEKYFSLTGYLEATETWKIRPTPGKPDEIILGRTEKAEVAVRWSQGAFEHELLWAFVEP